MDADALPFRHFTACVRGLLEDPASLLVKAAGGDGLTLADNLLCAAVDAMNVANWQRSKNGVKGINPPKSVRPQQSVRKPQSTLTPDEKRALLAAAGPPNAEPFHG
ncbi:DUF5361 domain-containing protein [Streptomyces sp. NPDC048507]|uniref:DUF5361 domain-containing protein n=1 Tax=Streptomyces sp. NPDC048507 TaxID=3365560 RepID=UPI0037136F55